jgi:SAM-dependent methyltransferase
MQIINITFSKGADVYPEKSYAFEDNTTFRTVIDSPDAYTREDETDDAEFYAVDRMVDHLDKYANTTVKQIIGQLIVEDNPVILDLMASTDSHLPEDMQTGEVIGLGLNENELRANRQLDDWLLADLNRKPHLPFEDDYFDVVINTVSIQYLVHPEKIFAEIARILKPGGLHLVIFSNRFFPTKAVKAWTILTEDERLELVKDYFRRSGMYSEAEVFISMGKPRPGDDKYADSGMPSDPIFAVYADTNSDKKTEPRPAPAVDESDYRMIDIKNRADEIRETLECPFCGERLRLWGVTDNPMSTWDHDLYICINDACSYTVKGWREMFRQGVSGCSYRFCFDPVSGTSVPIPIPSLAVLKESLKD